MLFPPFSLGKTGWEGEGQAEEGLGCAACTVVAQMQRALTRDEPVLRCIPFGLALLCVRFVEMLHGEEEWMLLFFT